MSDLPHAEVVTLLDRSKQLVDFIASMLDGRELPVSKREHVAGACFLIAFEHHTGIVHLVEEGIGAPALALLRPVAEAYFCGSWLLACADTNQLNNFTKGIRPPAERMIQALERSPLYSTGALADMKQTSWKALSGLTHTDIGQVLGVMGDGSLARNYRNEDLVKALNFSGAMSLLSAQGIAMIADDHELGDKVLDRCRQWASD